MKARYILAGLCGAIVLGNTPAIIAEARADVTAECYAHLSDKQSHTTPAADRRFHLERGEPSPCTEQDAKDGLPKASSDSGKPKEDRDKKSRHCRKHWYC
ncbi:hypothetical protein SEA_LITTLEGUY_75 [Mycobacterium phage LittleGuy]|uniref:RDF protein n=3 Tax=Backyardiganvirus peaches TaxID=663557 RepID=A0A1B1SEE4_9CAUD|nr:hypothetical protein PBI_MEDUSA_74 [Mycobacterium phage Medusa]AMS01450.1 hypothetical protein SEA_ROMNEY_74 [Mycobacterium phage Romney]ANU78972.1 hypothetical protein SEA_WILBUR_75 [Mycobacterium phage Wilbur]AOT27495.1 hypothetical protein SEA_LITTLEGUY_75 [Mycobacterium phage LittleGuy]QDF17075.1 hypothetical protein SEA_TYGERBLOOD_75 [Mycobacterium phage TygerBlood]